MAVTKLQIVTSVDRGESSLQPHLCRKWTIDGWSYGIADNLHEFVPGQIYATLTEDNNPLPPFTVDVTDLGLRFCGRQYVHIQSHYVFCRMDDNVDYILSLPKAGTLCLPVTKLETIFHYFHRVDDPYLTHWACGREGYVLELAAHEVTHTIYPMRYPDADLFPVLSSGTCRPYRTIGADVSQGKLIHWDVIPGTPDLSVHIAFNESSGPQNYMLQSLAQFRDLGIRFL